MSSDPLSEFGLEPRTGKGSPISLHDVVEQRVPVHWDEAVALVEEFCEVAIDRSGDNAGVPELEDILFGGEGHVTLRRTRGDKSPAAAGRTLHALLSGGDVPMALRLFVTQSTAHDAHGSLREFARGLAYFGKPGRQHLIQDLYARCARAERSTARSSAPVPPLPQSETTAKDDRQRRWKRTPITKWLFAAAGLALVTSGTWLWSNGRVAGDVQASADNILSHASEVLVELGQQVRDTIRPPAAAPAEAATPTNRADERARSRPRRSTPRADDVEVTAPLVTRQPRRSAAMLQLSLAVPNTVAPAQPPVYEESIAPKPEETPLYSSADFDVEPPILRFPQLTPPPLFASTSSPQVNRMVVVVSADGTVERVQLVEGPARMIDMMLLSGAKAWKFTPAFKDGEPVRYRTVISWAVGP